MSENSQPDFRAPAIQMAALTAIEAITTELERASDALTPEGGEPDPAAVRAALARASVLLAGLARWAGAVG